MPVLHNEFRHSDSVSHLSLNNAIDGEEYENNPNGRFEEILTGYT